MSKTNIILVEQNSSVDNQGTNIQKTSYKMIEESINLFSKKIIDLKKRVYQMEEEIE